VLTNAAISSRVVHQESRRQEKVGLPERDIRAGRVGEYLLLYASLTGVGEAVEFACLIKPDKNNIKLGEYRMFEDGQGYAAGNEASLSSMDDLRRILNLSPDQQIRDLVRPIN